MAVQLKRTSAAAIAELPVRDREALAAESAAQIDVLRADAIALLQRLGKGCMLWAEKEWEWEMPDWEADPETWPPVAKLLWILSQSWSAMHDANWLRHFPEHPLHCPNCPEPRTPSHASRMCREHGGHVETVQTLAKALFGADFVLPPAMSRSTGED